MRCRERVAMRDTISGRTDGTAEGQNQPKPKAKTRTKVRRYRQKRVVRHRPRPRPRSPEGEELPDWFLEFPDSYDEPGWSDTVVLERSQVASGTTWHAAGLMTRTRGTHMQTELAGYSRDFYRDLATLSGVDIGYYPNGSLSVARTPERLTELRYAITLARHHGLPARELTPGEIAAVSPILTAEGLVGGALFEQDATVNPGWAAYATAKAAVDLGVRLVEGVRVTGFRLRQGPGGTRRLTAVETDRGTVECEVAVIAAGLWSRELGLLAGARLALHPAEHYWAQTDTVEGATRDLPIVRDLDGSIYVRHYRGGLIVGAFEPDGRPRAASTIPADFSFGEFEPDLEHFGRPLTRARERVPALAGTCLLYTSPSPRDS